MQCYRLINKIGYVFVKSKNKFKKITAIILSAMIAVGSLTVAPYSALALASVSEEVSASSGITGNCSWSLDSEGILTISGSGAMEDYSENNQAPWGNTIRNVIIENGVTDIGSFSFRQSEQLTEAVIPKSMKAIGNRAFYKCTALNSVSIPEGMTKIGEYAFYRCYGLTKIDIPGTMTSIGSSAFAYCSGLKDIVISKGIAAIDSFVFYGTAPEKLTIPKSVKSIGNSTFAACEQLSSVSFPNGLQIIESGAFYNCPKLKKVIVSGSVSSIGNKAFGYFNPETYPQYGSSGKFSDFDIGGYFKHTTVKEYAEKNGL